MLSCDAVDDLICVLSLFTDEESCSYDDQKGCMDEEACNYNPRANVDGYCWFAPDGCLCEDGPNQDIDPCGTCFITTPYYHCMDLKVLNDFINLNPTLSG